MVSQKQKEGKPEMRATISAHLQDMTFYNQIYRTNSMYWDR